MQDTATTLLLHATDHLSTGRVFHWNLVSGSMMHLLPPLKVSNSLVDAVLVTLFFLSRQLRISRAMSEFASRTGQL